MIDLKPTFWTSYNKKEKSPLQVIELYGGPDAEPSDLALIQGAKQWCHPYFATFRTHKNATDYWIGDYDWLYGASMISTAYGYYHGDQFNRKIAGRPFLPPLSTQKIPLKDILSLYEIEYLPELKITPLQKECLKLGTIPNRNKLLIAKYGEFPQTVADEDTAKQLDNLLESDSLERTGKQYTFDTSEAYFPKKSHFVTHYEYKYNNNRYIHIVAQEEPFTVFYDRFFHDGRPVITHNYKKYWVCVEPIEWLVDPSGWWVAKDCLFAGIPFMLHTSYMQAEKYYYCDRVETIYRPKVKYYDGDFEKTNINHYLQNYFAREIQPQSR